MSALQKFAWFNLAIIAVTAVAVGALLPFLGRAALGCFGFLGFLGLGPLFFIRKRGHVVMDERDLEIQRRAWIVAYSIFWVIYVLAAVALTLAVYGEDGSVPVWVVQSSVFVAFMVVQALGSVAILVQYGGARDAE
jgi:hypothetical protein